AALRAFLADAPAELIEKVLDERELETLTRGYRERVTDTHLAHVAELPRVLPGIFADAAGRAREAGFDGVELHYAHAYTMASFLSALNTRADGYGGSRENRVRLPLEVYRAVRERVGNDYAVGVRFLGDEVIAGGSQLADAIYFAGEFARAGFDFLSLSKGGKFEDAAQPKIGHAVYPYTGESGYECMPTIRSDERGPFGRNVPLAAAVKRAINEQGFSTPVIAAGGICTFEQAEEVLRRNEADIIGAARQTLADPDWLLKASLGRGAEVRRCTYTNYCEGLDQSHKQVTCKLWDRVQLDEPDISLSHDGRRRLLPPGWNMGEMEEGERMEEGEGVKGKGERHKRNSRNEQFLPFPFPLSPFPYVFIVSRDESGVAPLEILVVDLLAARHQAVGEGQGRKVHVVARALEPDETFVGGLLIIFDDGPAHALELGERIRHAAARNQTAIERDSIFEGELRARPDGEVRRVQRVAEQHDVFVMPVSVLHQQEIDPLRVVRQQRVPAEVSLEHLAEIGARRLVR
ncbi:MAG TPA: hypothetical protein VGA87_03505, partial [Pyrinomonadaceae bacterium]